MSLARLINALSLAEKFDLCRGREGGGGGNQPRDVENLCVYSHYVIHRETYTKWRDI